LLILNSEKSIPDTLSGRPCFSYGTLTMTMSDHEFVAEMWKCRRGAQQAWKRIPKSNKAIRKWLKSLAGAYNIARKQAEEDSCPREEIERKLREVEWGFQFKVQRTTAALQGFYRVSRRAG
jgi:hypothetical protein